MTVHRDVHQVLKAQHSKLGVGSAKVAIAEIVVARKSNRNFGIDKLRSSLECCHIDAEQKTLQPDRLPPTLPTLLAPIKPVVFLVDEHVHATSNR